MSLDTESLRLYCLDAERSIRNNGLLLLDDGVQLSWDYAIYRLLDDNFYAIRISWASDIVDHIYSAKYDINTQTITDYYIIFPKGGEYFSAQINPITREYIALYRNEGDSEPKIDPNTGQVLQNNTYACWYDIPLDWQNLLRNHQFNYFDKIYCYSHKPYGKCVEFDISSIFPDKRLTLTMDGWFYLPFKRLSEGQTRINYYLDKGLALYHNTLDSEEIWMSNRSEQVLEMLDQVENAYGRVLCSGLGLGIIPLLIAESPQVYSITIVENNAEVISLFNQQGFISPKINIVQGDILTYTDSSYDSIMLDHYNHLGENPWNFLLDLSQLIRDNTDSQDAIVIPYAWQRLYIDSDETRYNMKMIGMPDWNFDYIGRYLNPQQGLSKISNLLSDINLKRVK